MPREDFFSYQYSEIKTKHKNHGLHESGKTPPPYINLDGSVSIQVTDKLL